MSQDPGSIATALVASGRGILAADETVPTLTKRFDAAWDKINRAEPPDLSRNALHALRDCGVH